MATKKILCRYCGTYNRVPYLTIFRIPICGRCKKELPANPIVKLIRITLKKKLFLLVVMFFLGAFSYKNFIDNSTQNQSQEIAGKSAAKQRIDDVLKSRKADTPNLVPIKQGVKIAPSEKGSVRFSVTTPAVSQNYYVKLINTKTNKTELAIYMEGGQTVSAHMPLGDYVLKYSSGEVWYGDQLLFGKHGRYREANRTISFTKKENTYYGQHVTLIEQVNGNLPSKYINKDNF